MPEPKRSSAQLLTILMSAIKQLLNGHNLLCAGIGHWDCWEYNGAGRSTQWFPQHVAASTFFAKRFLFKVPKMTADVSFLSFRSQQRQIFMGLLMTMHMSGRRMCAEQIEASNNVLLWSDDASRQHIYSWMRLFLMNDSPDHPGRGESSLPSENLCSPRL